MASMNINIHHHSQIINYLPLLIPIIRIHTEKEISILITDIIQSRTKALGYVFQSQSFIFREILNR